MAEEDLITKYAAWAARLEQNIADIAKQRRTFFQLFFGAVVVSALGFFFGVWLGAATFFTGLMVCIAGVYITTTRTWQYERELESTQREIARLQADAAGADAGNAGAEIPATKRS